jgi:hypothetical protein
MGRRELWIALALVAALDLAWSRAIGLQVVGWVAPFRSLLPFLVLALGAAWLMRRRAGAAERPVDRLYRRTGGLAHDWALLTAFVVVVGPLSYLSATPGRPLMDTGLAALDAALGFDWPSWLRLTRPVTPVLDLAYVSLFPQGAASVVLFALVGRSRRTAEMLAVGLVAALLTTAIAAVFPAEGAAVHFGLLDRARASWIPDLAGLRDGSLRVINIARMDGIVTFPSFHTALGVIFAYAHRGIRWVSPASLALNTLLVISVPSVGSHYLVDVIAGIAVATAAIVTVRALAAARGHARLPALSAAG